MTLSVETLCNAKHRAAPGVGGTVTATVAALVTIAGCNATRQQNFKVPCFSDLQLELKNMQQNYPPPPLHCKMN